MYSVCSVLLCDEIYFRQQGDFVCPFEDCVVPTEKGLRSHVRRHHNSTAIKYSSRSLVCWDKSEPHIHIRDSESRVNIDSDSDDNADDNEAFKSGTIYWGDRSQLVSNPVSNVFVNKCFGFVGCGTCGLQLDNANWHVHIERVHRQRLTPEERVGVDQALADHINDPRGQLDQGVQGLLLVQGYECACGFLGGAMSYYRNHKHTGMGAKSCDRVSLQRFTLKTSYFKVSY